MKHPLRLCRQAICTVLAALPLLGTCADDSQIAARVGTQDISVQDINFAMSTQPHVREENMVGESRKALDKLIDQALTVDEARKRGMDQDPRLLQRIEAARLEAVSRFYLDSAIGPLAQPTDVEIEAYYKANPNLFSRRRVYSLKELVIQCSPEEGLDLRKRLKEVANIDAFVDLIRSRGLQYTGNRGVQSAEQIPLALLPALAALKDKQSAVSETSDGLRVVFLESSRYEPVEYGVAAPRIRQFLVNTSRQRRIEAHLQDLRGSAHVQRFGVFAN